MPSLRETGIRVCQDERGQDLAEFTIMLAIILILVAGAMKLVGAH